MIYLIIGAINLIVFGLLLYEYLKIKKKRSYSFILDKNGEVMDVIKINPSLLEFKQKYENKSYSYILPEGTSFLKHGNVKYYLYEFMKPEPINPIKDKPTIMFGDVFDELLEMRKIKALNEVKKGLFDGFDKKYLFAGVVVVILIIVLFTGGI